MRAPSSLPIFCRLMLGGALGAALGVAPAAAQSTTTPERGVFITQIGQGGRADVVQNNAQSLARIVQDGTANQADLEQTDDGTHRAQIVQDGEGNIASATQQGDGATTLALAQEGDGNTAVVLQNEQEFTAETSATILQSGNGNGIILKQDGSDNDARLAQVGDGNTMTATQLNTGNRLEWSQSGDGLANLHIVQEGGGNLQITQSTTSAQFAPPPGSGG